MANGLQCPAEKAILTLEEADRRFTCREVIEAVASASGFTYADMIGSSRRSELVRPRHLAMMLAHKLTGFCLTDIGRFIGGRDHTTVLHGVRRVTRERDAFVELAEAACKLLRVKCPDLEYRGALSGDK